MSVLDKLLGVVAPHSCLGCQAEGSLLCPACTNLLQKIGPAALGAGTAYAVTPYGDTAKQLIWKLKSSGAQAAARLMASLMTAQLPPLDYLVVPIPTATSRVRQRGYDQARLLARVLARSSGLLYGDCLIRLGQAHQVGANRQQRLEQLNEAYRLKNGAVVQNQAILLVDDVMTTGASLEAASKLLYKAGAKQVDAITFARA